MKFMSQKRDSTVLAISLPAKPHNQRSYTPTPTPNTTNPIPPSDSFPPGIIYVHILTYVVDIYIRKRSERWRVERETHRKIWGKGQRSVW